MKRPPFRVYFFLLPQHPTLFASARVQFIPVICKETFALLIFIPPSRFWSPPNLILWDHTPSFPPTTRASIITLRYAT